MLWVNRKKTNTPLIERRDYVRKNKITKIFSIVLILVMTLLSACSKGTDNNKGTEESKDAKKVINIGVTYAPGTINPLSPTTDVATSVTGLMFLPLMEIDSDMEFKPMLAKSITTEDNITFTITLDERAKWTDGKPVTSDDVIFTINRMATPAVGSIYSYIYGMIEGFDDYGYIDDGENDMSGVIRVDDHTIQFVAKEKVALNTFNNSIARYLWTIPKHVLEDIDAEQLIGSDFFLNPNVTNGPFTLAKYDKDHYVQLVANKDYFKGTPKINQLNFNVMQASQIYPRLQSGEIDFNLPTIGIIPVEDYENIKALENVSTFLEEPIANQYVYIDEDVFPDARVRKAFVYAINRQMIVEELLKGNGEVIDGFFTSYSPYFDETLGITEYNPEKAKELLQEASWDSSKEINLSVSSGDETLAQAATIIAANLEAVGVKAKIQLKDLGTLLDELYSMDFEVGILQYSFTPIEPYSDISYLLMNGNVNGYYNEEVDTLLNEVKSVDDINKVKEIYARVNKISSEEVPMFSVYATRSLVAISDRVTGVNPRAFGAFINVHEWDIK